MKQGDLVVRKSYGGDIVFRIADFAGPGALLRGKDYRLLADAPLSDLVPVRDPDALSGSRLARIQANESLRRMREERLRLTERAGLTGSSGQRYGYFEMPGKVLHLDGDLNYLRKSMQVYEQLKVPAEGFHCHESQMPEMLMQLLPKVRPNIVVITGHDGVVKHRNNLHQLTSYKNSLNFVNAVTVARAFERDLDSLNIVAGACQSHFEALMSAGANFASSPARIMIHALDPVYVAVRSAFTPFRDTINVMDVITHTISGAQGVGGIETRGCYRIGMPGAKLQSLNVNIV
jgi:spore coat assembly protein